MKIFYKALVFGLIVSLVKFLLWKFGLTLWEIGLVGVSGLVAGIFFILAAMFKSALHDYKEADKNICNIRGKISSMNDMNINAALLSDDKYDSNKFSDYLIEILSTIKKYLKEDTTFNNLQDVISGLVYEITILDEFIPANKTSRLQQYHDHLRGYISYLEYAKSLHFPKVGYTFLYFFIFLLLLLQIFSDTQNILLEVVFIFSLSSVLMFFADLVRDLDRPFKIKGESFIVDLSPINKGIRAIERSKKQEDEKEEEIKEEEKK